MSSSTDLLSSTIPPPLAQQLIEKGAKVITLSDSKGYIKVKDGLTDEMMNEVLDLKLVRRGRISELADKFDEVEFTEGKRPWGEEGDIAFPCATQVCTCTMSQRVFRVFERIKASAKQYPAGVYCARHWRPLILNAPGLDPTPRMKLSWTTPRASPRTRCGP